MDVDKNCTNTVTKTCRASYNTLNASEDGGNITEDGEMDHPHDKIQWDECWDKREGDYNLRERRKSNYDTNLLTQIGSKAAMKSMMSVQKKAKQLL